MLAHLHPHSISQLTIAIFPPTPLDSAKSTTTKCTTIFFIPLYSLLLSFHHKPITIKVHKQPRLARATRKKKLEITWPRIIFLLMIYFWLYKLMLDLTSFMCACLWLICDFRVFFFLKLRLGLEKLFCYFVKLMRIENGTMKCPNERLVDSP